MEDCRTVAGVSAGEYEEKKSRFIAAASNAPGEEEAIAFLEKIRAENRTARHNVYAYRLRGGRERYSDDGEPAKTAGTPVLQVLQHSGLTDVIIVVTRYFGGVLLGTGGLVRAYSGAVKEGIAASKIGTMRYGVRLKICTDYNGIGRIQYILRQNGLEAEDTVYTDQVELTVLLAAECVPGLKKEITEATAAKAGIEEVEKLYFVAPDA